jgi:hypothetical protein
VWGDKEAEAAGIYETPATKPAAQPVQTAAAPAGGMKSTSLGEMTPQQRIAILAQALRNPNLSEQDRRLGQELLKEELKQARGGGDDTPLMVNLKSAGLQPGSPEWNAAVLRSVTKPAAEVTIDQKGETSFKQAFGKHQAERWNGYITAGDAAERRLVDIKNMRTIADRVGSQGAWAGVKQRVGPWAEALGIDVANLSDIQAFTSIVERLAPQQRVPGSGATSDIEYKGMKNSMPLLIQVPSARVAILDTMEALARHEVGLGDIASRLASDEISRVQAEREMRALPDPMAAFNKWKEKNPQIYAMAESRKPGGGQPSPAEIEAEMRRRKLIP